VGTFSIWHWLIVVFMFAPFAIGNYFIADRMERSKVLWVILTLIPFVNFIFMYYVMFAVVIYILGKLNQLTEQPEASLP
jgi:hypothetical protein